MSKKKRVIVGMSGGVDSSVSAALLVEQGYEVMGITIKTYNYEDVGGNANKDTSCCSLDGINDARSVCEQLGIPHYVLDFSEKFKENVIDLFIAEYLAGNTPNPCVICNRKIKWEELIRKGIQLEADYVAMGHYAKIKSDEISGRYWITRGKDIMKDQSYALWNLTQESLSRTIFPLGDMTKDEVRKYAERVGLKTAGKNESYEICFIPDNNYGRFLRENVTDLEQRVSGGEVILDEKIIGKHTGYPFYTIGQRKGLHIAVGEPVFVTKIDSVNNKILLGRESDLMHTTFTVHSINLMKLPAITSPTKVITKIRYKDEGSPSMLLPQDDGEIVVQFDQPKRAITPGQSTVWYDGDDIVGGAIIKEILE